MTFSISSAKLSKALELVRGAIGSKPSQAILECIKMRRDGDELVLTATDLDISLQHRIEVTFTSEPGGLTDCVAVPAGRFVDTCKSLGDMPIVFSVDSHFTASMATDQGQYSWMGHDGQNFPQLPKLKEETTVTFTHQLLQRAFRMTGFAASTDPVRPAMQGILFEFRPQEVRAVTSDGHRLVKYTMKGFRHDTGLSVIVPMKALTLATRVDDAGMFPLSVDENHVYFALGKTRIFSNLINHKFPKYEAVIPLDNNRVAEINRQLLYDVVRRVGMYSSAASSQIRFKLADDRLEVRAQDLERASKAVETIECDYKSDPIMIGFNSVYLEDVLKILDTENVKMSFGSPNRAGLVEPISTFEDEHLVVLVMPVMLNTYI
ncbi:MAG: DNA polymerase III subunit beta [Bacteroidota bacterium]|nr:DNA polymerase III subunit beta [Bacteroidota bacterium]MDE2835089.1 DNA polymerase III subunit beta [Bacteroidota bacterium]MDE2956350.1 DNA polymerase III subunit beta [Bacteroidota bacterium]